MENEPFDAFLWANEIDEVKNNVSAELFLFNKNYKISCKNTQEGNDTNFKNFL